MLFARDTDGLEGLDLAGGVAHHDTPPDLSALAAEQSIGAPMPPEVSPPTVVGKGAEELRADEDGAGVDLVERAIRVNPVLHRVTHQKMTQRPATEAAK